MIDELPIEMNMNKRAKQLGGFLEITIFVTAE